MSQLIRMDHSGHTVLATWSAENRSSVEAAEAALRRELEQGMLAIATGPDGSAEQVRELPLDVPTVILRRPIAGG